MEFPFVSSFTFKDLRVSSLLLMENGIFFSFLRVSNLLSFEKSEKVDFNGGKKK